MIGVAAAVAAAAYVVAALLFILSLAGLSKHETSRRGVAFGIIGMVIALVATVWVTAAWAWGQPQATLDFVDATRHGRIVLGGVRAAGDALAVDLHQA